MVLVPYRPRDGWLVRRGFFVLAVGFGAFAAFRAYLWGKRWMLPYARIGRHPLNWGELMALVVVAAVFALSYYVMFLHRRSVEFLIETERELREVAWPEYRPVASPKAELWGSTYIVIAVVIVMGVFVYLVDGVYQVLANLVFYNR